MPNKRNWQNVFSGTLSKNGYTQKDIQRIFVLEMKARSFFDFGGIVPEFLILQNIERDDEKIQYFWDSHSTEAQCPFCKVISSHRCNDIYTKPIQDIPQDNAAVYHVVRHMKYFCENPQCIYQRFVERLEGFAEEDARKTIRFKKYCVERSLGCGCKPAEDSLKKEGAVVSNDTIARYLKAESAKKIESNITRDDVKVLAVDDINLRKGDKSSGCTVFLDEETHRVMIIVKGTTKEATKRALEMFPSSQFFSRDRASAYSSAASECGKTQIADRFHLVKNAQEAVKEALMTTIPATIFIREGDGWVQVTPGDDTPIEKMYFYVPETIVEERIRAAKLTPAKAKRYRNTLKILELADKGVKTADIAQTMDLPIKDVRSLRRTAVNTISFVEDKINSNINFENEAIERHTEELFGRDVKTIGPKAHPASESIVEPYREIVIDQLKVGGNHRTIYPIIQGQGYSGSCNAVYQYILKLRKEIPDEVKRELTEKPPDLTLDHVSRNEIYKGILKEAADSRQKPPEKNQDTNPQKKKTIADINSPLSTKARTLIFGDYGSDKGSTDETPTKEKKPKKKHHQ